MRQPSPSPPDPSTPALSPPRAALAQLRARDHHGIAGKFHSHVTVALEDEAELEALRAFCRARRIKVTLIDLADFGGRRQRDIMTTQHYQIDGPQAVREIIDALDALCAALEAAGYGVARVKLEHESAPTLPRFDRSRYREAHVKLRVPPERHAATMAWLGEHQARFGYVPSRNPRARGQGQVIQFVNLRLYEGDVAETDRRIDALVAFLREEGGLDVGEVKRETTVFDTNQGLDGWWA